MNVFGEKWTFTSFGESHGAAIGGVLDGVPAGLKIDLNLIREELERRSKGNPWTVLVGMEIDTVTMGNRMEVLQKIKNETTILSSISTLVY